MRYSKIILGAGLYGLYSANALGKMCNKKERVLVLVC